MTQQDTTGELADHGDAPGAVVAVYRALAASPEVGRVERIGCTELAEGGMLYGLHVVLGDGQELLVDAQAFRLEA